MSAATAWAPQGALTLQSAGALMAVAEVDALASGKIDLSGVTEADSAALAMLIALIRAARADGRVLEIANMPAGLRALAELYDVSDLLAPSAAA